MGMEVTFFLLNQNGEAFSDTGFGNTLRNLFEKEVGKRLGIDALRKIYISEMLYYIHLVKPDKYSHLSHEEQMVCRHQMAYAMGHSLDTQEFLYSSFRDCPSLKKSSPKHLSAMVEFLQETVGDHYR